MSTCKANLIYNGYGWCYNIVVVAEGGANAYLQRRKNRIVVLQICFYWLDGQEEAEKEDGL